MTLMSLLVLSRLCCVSAIDCRLPVVMYIVKEQDGAVMGVSWPLPSGLASGPLNAHCLFSYHTSAADMIK